MSRAEWGKWEHQIICVPGGKTPKLIYHGKRCVPVIKMTTKTNQIFEIYNIFVW